MIIRTKHTDNENTLPVLRRWHIYKSISGWNLAGKRYKNGGMKNGRHIEVLLLKLEAYNNGYTAYTFDDIYFLPKDLVMENTDLQQILDDISEQNDRLSECAEKLLDEGDCLFYEYNVFYRTCCGVTEAEPTAVTGFEIKYSYPDDGFELAVQRSGECSISFGEAYGSCSLYEISFDRRTISKTDYRSLSQLCAYPQPQRDTEIKINTLFYYDDIVERILNKNFNDRRKDSICSLIRAYSDSMNYYRRHYNEALDNFYLLCIETGAEELLPYFGVRREWRCIEVYIPYINLYSGKNTANVRKSILHRTAYHYDGYCLYEMYHLIKNKFYEGIVQRLDRELLFTQDMYSMSGMMGIAVRNRDAECLELFLERGFMFCEKDKKYLLRKCRSFMEEQVLPMLEKYSGKDLRTI